MDWATGRSSYGPPSPSLPSLKQYEEKLKSIVALDEVIRGALFRREQNPPTWFMPDGTIKLLPEDCRINLAATAATTTADAASQSPAGGRDLHLEPFEREVPQWKPLQMLTRLVGKVRATFTADQYRHPGRRIEQFGHAQQFVFLVVDPPTPTAGRDVFLHPKAIAPYYDLVTDEEIIVDIQDVEMNEDANDEVKRLEIIATLLEDWDTAYSLQYSTFTLKARNWRRERREWELEAVQTIFYSGNLHMLDPDFNISSLVNARRFVLEKNAMERAGDIEVWEGVWEKEGCDAVVECQRQVRKTTLRVKQILFDLIPEDERGLARNRVLMADIGWLLNRASQGNH